MSATRSEMPTWSVVAGFGAVLILAGILALIWTSAMAATMDAVAPDLYFDTRNSGELGYGVLELLVRDLRLAPWTLVVAGFAALVTLRLSATRSRRLLAITGLVMWCSALALEGFVGYGAWVDSRLPAGYVAAVSVLQLALVLAGLGALLIAGRKTTGWHVALIAAAVATGGSMLAWDGGLDWRLVVLFWSPYVGLAVSAAVAGEMPEWGNRRRVVLAGVVSGLTFLPAYVPAFVLNVPIGAALLELNGGHIDVDGLPLFLAGPLSAWLPVVIYLIAVNRWSIFLPKQDREPAIARSSTVAA